MEKFFDEPMLNKVNFINGKNAINFEFYDSSSGQDLGDITCNNIFIFNYHTNFKPNEESFPCLVFDVYTEKLTNNDEIKSIFKKLNYGYSSGYVQSDIPAIPKSDSYYYFKIVNGPVDISVVCQNVEVHKK